MLNAREKRLLITALKIMVALDSRNPKPIIGLLNKHRANALEFMPEKEFQEALVAINELTTTTPLGHTRAIRRKEILDLLEQDDDRSMVMSRHSRDALNLFMRVGILQFDIISEELFLPFTSGRYDSLVEVLRGLRNFARPGIHSQKIDPVFKRAYELGDKLKRLSENPLEKFIQGSDGKQL